MAKMTKQTKESAEILDTHNKVTPKELEKVLTKNVKIILDNPESAEYVPSLFVWGSPGIGKSQIVKQVTKDLGIEFIDFRLSYRDPVDLHGIPAADIQNNRAMWLPFEDLPQNPDGKGIILFDEMSSVDKSLQNAALQIILDRRIDKYKVPDGYYIVAAGNKVTDRAISQTMASSLSNRFLHLELDANDEDWRMWGQQHDIHPAVMGFISYRPTFLHKMEGENLERGWPSPRSWERVSTILKKYEDEGDDHILRKLVYGLVGNGAGVEFMEFYKINQQFVNVKEMMLNPNLKIEIPERADARYALVSAMNYQLWRGRDEEEEKKLIDGFYRINMELTSDFASMSMMTAMEGISKETKTTCCHKLFTNSNYKKWSEKHGKSLRKRYTFD